MLIESPRHSAEDLEFWHRVLWRMDQTNGALRRLERMERRAMENLQAFKEQDKRAFYVGVSWGKDSVVVAHLAWRIWGPETPLAWFPAGMVENPDNWTVRDMFLSRFDSRYTEIEASGHVFAEVDGHDGAQEAFEKVSSSLAPRYVSGVRAEESGLRKWRMRVHGPNSRNTSAPIGWWKGLDVFAYLAKYNLPIHPAYACTMGGTYDRQHIRVSTIGGWRGAHRGRAQWEERYYPEHLRAIQDSREAHG